MRVGVASIHCFVCQRSHLQQGWLKKEKEKVEGLMEEEDEGLEEKGREEGNNK